jgi:glucose/arabinose dehydrogenase
MHRFLIVCIAMILLAAVAWTSAQPGKPKQPVSSYECRFTDTPIKITGKGNDPAWKNAQPIDHFYLPWLGDKARPAKTATKAKLLWDREYLYFFADMQDADIYADIKEHNGMLWFNDVFELFFKPSDDKPGYYEFQVNPAGAVLDCFFPRRNAGGFLRFKNDTKFHVDAKVNLRGTLNKWTDKDDGWSVEGKIPWTDFMKTGGRPEPGEKWKFSLSRYDYSVDFEGPELSTCAPLKQRDFHAFEDYATLTFVGPDKNAKPKGVPTTFVPMTTSRVVGFPDPLPPYQVTRVYPDMKIALPQITHLIPGTDQLLVITSPGAGSTTKIYAMKDDPGVKTWDLWYDSAEVVYQLAFHPKFAENGYVYFGSNGNGPSPLTPAAKREGKKKTRLTRYTMETKSPYKIIPGSEKIIIEAQSDGHNGAAPVFGHDGMMYLTTGDGTSDSDTLVVGQDMSSLLAKVLRIDVDHPDPGKNYSVPKDNPFVNMKDARPEIWALGLRNPWRSCVDEKTGHLWVGQNGQDLWEQAFLVKKGDNYGWSVMEGSHPFWLERKLAPVALTKPTVEHHHSEARSLTGGVVYYGKKYPDLVGHYIYGDYSTGKIWAVKHDGDKVVAHREICDSRLTLTGFGFDSHGEILISHFESGDKGGLYTFVPTPKDAAPSIFPKKLSESGLFKSVNGHVMEDALIPYSVNAVLWSDGAAKERWLGLPKGTKIDYRKSRGWGFPDQTVIVKSFYIETEEGNPQSKRWIETRFLTKQGTEWYGYSYAWNDEQTEGELIEAKGLDREYTIKTKAGDQKLNWHYPSRAECMVCHSRAAHYVLGLSELQFNHEHTYGPTPVRANQLAVFEGLGLFPQFNWTAETNDKFRQDLKNKGRTTKEIDAEIARRSATRDQRTARSSSLLPFTPPTAPRLVDPYDKAQDLNLRARSYLHSNCAQCHVEAGGGNAQMELEFTTPLDKMRIINVKPVHDTFGIKDAKLVAPGHPERSVLLHRISHRDKGHMPPLATRVVDRAAVEMLTEWIRTMK